MFGDSRVNELKTSLSDWKEVVVAADTVLSWRQDWHPAVTAGALTTIVGVVWYYNPTLLGLTCSLLAIASLLDYIVPRLLPLVVTPDMWTDKKEEQYDNVVKDLLFISGLLSSLPSHYNTLRQLHPTVVFIGTVLSLLLVSYIGSFMSGLSLSYLLLMTVLMMPGLYRRGLLDKYCGKVMDAVRETIKGKKRE